MDVRLFSPRSGHLGDCPAKNNGHGPCDFTFAHHCSHAAFMNCIMRSICAPPSPPLPVRAAAWFPADAAIILIASSCVIVAAGGGGAPGAGAARVACNAFMVARYISIARLSTPNAAFAGASFAFFELGAGSVRVFFAPFAPRLSARRRRQPRRRLPFAYSCSSCAPRVAPSCTRATRPCTCACRRRSPRWVGNSSTSGRSAHPRRSSRRGEPRCARGTCGTACSRRRRRARRSCRRCIGWCRRGSSGGARGEHDATRERERGVGLLGARAHPD